MGVLVAIIISIASFFVLAGVISKFLISADDVTAENACRDSIALRAATAFRIGAEDSAIQSTQIKAIPKVCKTIDKKIEGDREEIKKQMATKIARCWWQFGDGRYEEILKNSDTSIMPLIYGTGSQKNQCFVCYVMIVDQDKIEPDDKADCRQYGDNCPISSQEFISYLYDTPYKTKQEKCTGNDCIPCETNDQCSDGAICQNSKCQPVQTLSYLEYVQSYGGPGQIGFLTDNIEAGNTYAITFLPKNRPVGGTWWGAAAAVGGVIVSGLACTATLPVCLVGAAVGTTIAGFGGAAVGMEASKSKSFVDYDKLDRIFKEREYSSIYVSDLTTAQHFCADGDILGN